MVNATLWSFYPWERDLVSIVWEVGWAPGQVWMGAENFRLYRIRSPDRPDSSDLLYSLCYSGPIRAGLDVCKGKSYTKTYLCRHTGDAEV